MSLDIHVSSSKKQAIITMPDLQFDIVVHTIIFSKKLDKKIKYSKGSTVLRDLVCGYDEINRRTSYSGNTASKPQETATTNTTSTL